MPTNDERREVAARLWKHIGKPLFTGQDVEDIIGAQRSDFDAILADASYRRLADLIEPEERTCRNIAKKSDREFGNPFVCSECGADPHDAESYYCGFSSGEYDWRFCPNCGARVIPDA